MGGVRWGLCLALASAASACGSDSDPREAETYTREKLMDPETCNECHQDHYEEWSGSMHAYASRDPVFRAMNARGQEETKGELGAFCVNCHAPLAVAEKATTDGLDLDSVPKRLQGVTCYFCHNVKEVQDTHLNNNPLLLANDVTMRGSITDPVKFRAHKSEYAKHLDGARLADSSKMCGTCHDIVVPGHFSGSKDPSTGLEKDVLLEQTFAEWQKTVFAQEGSGAKSCGSCHMSPLKNLPIAAPPDSTVTMPVRRARHEHLFDAIDTAHEGFPQKDVQSARIQDRLDKSVVVRLCAGLGGGAGAIYASVENNVTGHDLPSGASIDRRMWVEFHVFDRPGGLQRDPDSVERFNAGVVPEGISAAVAQNSNDVHFLSLWDKATKNDGATPAHMFWDVASISKGTIPGQSPGLATDPVPTSTVQPPNSKYVYVETGISNLQTVRIEATLWLEPVGLDVLDDLQKSGHLKDDSIRANMPRYALLPNRSVQPPVGADGRPVTAYWTLAATKPPKGDKLRHGATLSFNNMDCTETSTQIFDEPDGSADASH